MKATDIHHKDMDDLPESDLEILTRKLLVKRYEAYQQNREKLSKPLESLKSEIQVKYGWNEKN